MKKKNFVYIFSVFWHKHKRLRASKIFVQSIIIGFRTGPYSVHDVHVVHKKKQEKKLIK